MASFNSLNGYEVEDTVARLEAEVLRDLIEDNSTSTDVKINTVQGNVNALDSKVTSLTTQVNTTSEQIETNKSNITTLSGRVDAFTSLASGSTTGDAELIDGRTDIIGQTWTNIGGHIRGISDYLDKKLGFIKYARKLDVANTSLYEQKIGLKPTSSGWADYTVSGTVYSCLVVPVTYGQQFYFNKSSFSVYRLDANKNYISGQSGNVQVVNRKDCKYLAFSYTALDSVVIFETNQTTMPTVDGELEKYYVEGLEGYFKFVATANNYGSIANLPNNSYTYCLPSWFSDVNLVNMNNGTFIYCYGNQKGSVKMYKAYDVTAHIEYTGYLHNGVINWVQMPSLLSSNKLKVANFGDSLTWGRDGAGSSTTRTNYTITNAIRNILGYDADNYGVGGIGFFEDAGGQIALTKLQATDITDYDVITLAFGTNDNSATLGTVNDTSGTMLGALYQCIAYIRSVNKKCKIIVIAPPNASSFGSASTDYWYGHKRGSLYDYTLTELVEGMRELCKKYHVGFIDNYESGLDQFNITTLMPDGVHFNDEGYEIYSTYIAKQIGSMI